MAAGGLYTADSLHDLWRRVTGTGFDPDPDDLRIGTTMAFVDDHTAILGIDTHAARGERTSLLYRTTDGGGSWSPMPDSGLASIDAMAALGRSVWVVATHWEDSTRRATLLRSSDGGLTWDSPQLPRSMNDITVLYRVSSAIAYAATAGYNRGPVLWQTTDGGDSWSPVQTPHDQDVHDVPSYGVRVQEIATVGKWLLVREYGTVFITGADLIRWRRFTDGEHIASDRESDRLFVLTDSLHAALIDADLKVLWRSVDRVPLSRPTNVEKVLARNGVGYVSMTHKEIYHARDGVLRMIQPRTR